MPKFKTHKTVEQIAKKHGIDVSFIQKQLDMGEPIEHEHTKDHDLARNIALQHLGEIPDYYTRLKKMEKKAKSVKEETVDALSDVDQPVHMPPVRGIHTNYEKRYCPKCKKEELKSECKYGPRYWELFSVPGTLGDMIKVEQKDHEHSMARSELATIDNAVKRLRRKLSGEGNIEAWVQSKITKAADYLDTAADYVDSGEHNVTNESKLVDTILDEIMESKKRGLWANIHAKRKRGKRPAKPGEKGYPKTLNIEENEIEEGIKQARKNVGASKCWKGKKLGNPSTKIKGGKEVPNCVPEDVTIEDANGNTFVEVVDLIKPEPIKGFKTQVDEATRLQSQSGNVIAVTLIWRGKYYSLKMFFPQVKLPSRKEINDELQKVYPGSKVVYHSVSEIQPGQPLIQAFGPQGGSYAKPGPNRNYVKPMGEEVEIDEDWQKVNRQDKTDGLSQKAVNVYRRENPGSKLQTAVTEKNPTGKRAERRKSFCSRMSGMKKRLTSAETARDPDSRINKALRRWNCN